MRSKIGINIIVFVFLKEIITLYYTYITKGLLAVFARLPISRTSWKLGRKVCVASWERTVTGMEYGRGVLNIQIEF